jgi:Holliday junction resolvasome RuvABC endonuclease subunit
VIAGVDSATKNLGIAHTDGVLETLNARAGSEDPVRRLHELWRALTRAVGVHPPRPALFVVEGYGLGTPGRLALVRLGEVGGMVRLAAFEFAAEVVEIAPSALKRYATGNGSAGKPQMIEAALELGAVFSRPVTGNEKTDPHDEADAFLLRHAGRAAVGLEPVDHDYRREVVASIVWPIATALVWGVGP